MTFFDVNIFIILYFIYFVLIIITSTIQNQSIAIGFLSIYAVINQFWGYGIGFLSSFIRVRILKQQPVKAFPELFFKPKL
jgi:hypothetical protein